MGLDPILESEEAQAVHLQHFNLPKNSQQGKVTTSRRSIVTNISDPDNGIMFLDGFDVLKNPVNQKTPPPPMWGEVLEEDLYDENTPFYDDELAMKEAIAREQKLAIMRGEHPDPERKPKRKVIYVYEKDTKTENNHPYGS